MEIDEHPQLQGFDSYELKLGDELRGERASMGKTLLDVQRDLRIRADYIDAIENADASAFPFAGFAAGYVRSYARYLGLDGDDVYRRFCIESGFEGVETSGLERNAIDKPLSKGGADPVKDLSLSTKFLEPNKQAMRIDFGASLRGAASVAALAAFVVGLGYGGWSMLENLQRVGFAPLPDAPDVHVSAPDFLSPDATQSATVETVARFSPERESLEDIYAAQETAIVAVEPRDGPISSIDPASAGIYAPPAKSTQPVVDLADLEPGGEGEALLALVDPGLRRAANIEGATYAMSAELRPAIEEDETQSLLDAAPDGVAVHAVEEAWVRVRDEAGRVLFTGILGAGERFVLPADAAAPVLRAGNAGGVFIVVGSETFGPLGAGPEVAKNVALSGDAVKEAYPLATDVSLAPVMLQREASVAEDEATTGVAILDRN